ncbi:MAG: SusD/RagB family nutrient-binding outer membrane lipoprotein [Bacteroidales bacterium]|nr:SusD/RagB family nutrient-binding outer membrane lipoprotein [Bacteroidales bacterium]MDD2632740.1 SusD/RagB family nutrient-binding outer membrane lipoprotein [Bacteroidales bacterium]MDD4178245.1 SusD/RagB family nutrient-binding outer membrane lipoprotein [Bacteroidales bacterium]MDD4741588.1 SusD/RagB family nutrient-binding outer membrane lipoprotein [Bacteroidales bacterium]
MNKIIKFLTIPVLLLIMAGCTQDILEDINVNKNNPTDVPSKLLITDAMTKTAFSIVGSDLAFYASVYVEHNVGIYNQMYNAEIRSGEPSLATTYNNSWGSIYETLYNLKIIINKTSPGGDEEANVHTLGVAQILTAYNLAILTDLFGDVPYEEALQPGVIFQPKLDSQESLYAEIFRLLDEGIANLEKETLAAGLGGQDFIYKGNIANWKKFAWGLKARYTARLALRNSAWDQVIEYANKSFTSASEEAKFVYDGSTTNSPFLTFFKDRDYFGASTSLHEKLIARNDMRDATFFIPYPDLEEINFAANGAPEQVQGFYGISGIMSPTAPTYLLSYHEILFLKAEAQVRNNNLDEAKATLEDAVEAAFEKVEVGMTLDSTYRVTIQNQFDAAPLKEVMTQKYLAFFESEAVEAYNDIRRLKAMGDNVITLANPLKFPLRYTYGADDVTTNLKVAAAYGTGAYIYTENVWWAGGTR